MTRTADIEATLGISLFDYQRTPIEEAPEGPSRERHRSCLFYKTGAGKSITSLGMVAVMGYDESVVVAPPSTHVSWCLLGEKLGVQVEAMSHAKFRMKTTQLSRHKPVIADEMHMFGGHKGKGWKRLEALANGLQAPLIMASATPNYNDAERVYCIQRILDRNSTKGGYIEFLYRECNTEQSPYGMEPLVSEQQPFRHHKTAADYLAALPGVYYLPDDLIYTIEDMVVPERDSLPSAPFNRFGYDRRKHRVMASIIEAKHTRIYNNLVASNGMLRPVVRRMLEDVFDQFTQQDLILIFCNHSSVAEVLAQDLHSERFSVGLVTGDTSPKAKEAEIEMFRMKSTKILIGTASLATGTDGLDKVCDTLIIFDDTDDDALRRQLIGRIMPRGVGAQSGSSTGKRVIRFLQEQ